MNRIKELRTERGLSTRDLASEMDWSAMAISYYENKKRDLNTDALIKLAKYFEVTCDYLLGVSTYCLFVLYEKGHLYIKVNEDDYHVLKDKGIIYFNKNDNRCINFNKLVNVREDAYLTMMIEESVRNKKIDLLFDKAESNNKSISIKKLNSLLGDLEDIDFSLIDVNKIAKFFEES